MLEKGKIIIVFLDTLYLKEVNSNGVDQKLISGLNNQNPVLEGKKQQVSQKKEKANGQT